MKLVKLLLIIIGISGVYDIAISLIGWQNGLGIDTQFISIRGFLALLAFISVAGLSLNKNWAAYLVYLFAALFILVIGSYFIVNIAEFSNFTSWQLFRVIAISLTTVLLSCYSIYATNSKYKN